jgi:hypothetical protein
MCVLHFTRSPMKDWLNKTCHVLIKVLLNSEIYISMKESRILDGSESFK